MCELSPSRALDHAADIGRNAFIYVYDDVAGFSLFDLGMLFLVALGNRYQGIRFLQDVQIAGSAFSINPFMASRCVDRRRLSAEQDGIF